MSNKTIIITGASSGIGEAAAKALARSGAHLCLVARREEELTRVKADIEREGGSATIYPTDLSDLTAIDACCAAILRDHPQIDVLINNAGRSIRRPIKESLDRFHDYERTMQLNYFGSVRMTLKLLPRFLEQRMGHIINVSSLSALVPTPYFSAYVASKSALDGFSRSIAAELMGDGITVTTINYPLVKTQMTAPTKIYKYLPLMDVEVAAGWIVAAIKKRPARKTSLFGETFGVITAALPGTTIKGFGLLFKTVGKRLQKRADKEQRS